MNSEVTNHSLRICLKFSFLCKKLLLLFLCLTPFCHFSHFLYHLLHSPFITSLFPASWNWEGFELWNLKYSISYKPLAKTYGFIHSLVALIWWKSSMHWTFSIYHWRADFLAKSCYEFKGLKWSLLCAFISTLNSYGCGTTPSNVSVRSVFLPWYLLLMLDAVSMHLDQAFLFSSAAQLVFLSSL